MRSTGPAVRLAALYGTCFAVLGVWIPFFPVWLEQRGLDPSAIGIVLALSILVRAVFAAPLMTLVDRGFGARRLFMAGALIVALGSALLSMAEGAFVISAVVAMIALAQAPMVPLSDWAATEAIHRDPRLQYGRIRLWGSIAFLAANVVAGYVIGAAGAGVVVWLLVALSVVSLAAVCVAPLSDPEPADAREGAPETPASSLPIALWCVLAAAACIQASHAALYGFASIEWRARGFPEPAIGYLWATGVLAEIALFALVRPDVDSVQSTVRLLMLGGAAAVVRFGAMALEPGLPVTFALQALHGLSFGATHLGTMAALSLLASPAWRGRVQGLLGSALPLASAGASVVSGMVFRNAGALAFAAMVPLAGIGMAFAAVAARSAGSQPHRAGEGG